MAKAMRDPQRRPRSIVIGGKDRGKTGRVLRIDPKKQPRLRRGPEHRQAPPAPALGQGHPARRRGRRHHREGGPDPRLQRDAARPQGQQADPRRRRARRGRQARARRQAQPEGDRLMEAATATAAAGRPAAAAARALREEIQPALIERFGYSTPMQAPRLEKITLNMGVGEAKQDTKMLEAAQPSSSRRSPASARACAARASRSPSFKLREGMPVGVAVTLRASAHVGVPRPAELDRDPADPRLPRPQPALLRRPRQLLAWASASRSSSPRSTTTRSTRSAAST